MLNHSHTSQPLAYLIRLFLPILWSNPSAIHCARASWHPSAKPQRFATFSKTDLGILQENTNDLLLLSWHPSKPTNIHAGFLTAFARENTPFYPSSTPEPAILHQNPNVLPFLSWHPSKPRNIHARLLTAKSSKNTVFSRAQTTTWHPSKQSQCFATFNLASFKTNQYPCMFALPQSSRRSRPLYSQLSKNSYLGEAPPTMPSAANYILLPNAESCLLKAL
ncbi:MAG: hypothetical protein ACP5O1_11105 [Phycisphaerae bacterium]